MAEDEVLTQPPPPQQSPEPSIDELDPAAASAAASAAAATTTAPLLVVCTYMPTIDASTRIDTLHPQHHTTPQRLLQQVRALSIRNLSAALGPDSAPASLTLPALPSTYIKVLVPPSQPPRPDAHANGDGGGGGDDASSSSKSWEVLWTSEVAPETLNPSWLLLDLGAALRRLQRKGRWRSTGAAAGGGEGQEEEEEGGGDLEWEARVRLFALVDGGGGGGAVQGAGGGYGDEEQGQEAWLVPPVPGIVAGGDGGNSARQRHRGPAVAAPSDAPSQSQQERPPPLLLAEFVLRASGLRCLPPQLPLSRLPLPADRAACLLATREGGEGLVVPGDLYDALLQLTANGAGAEGGEETGGGGSRSSSRVGTPTHHRAPTGPEKGAFFAAAAASSSGAGGRVDEAWVAELEEDHHLGFFSTSGDEEEEEADGPAAPAPAVANGDDAVGEATTGATAALVGVEGRREAQRLADEAARLWAAVAGAEERLRLEEGALEEEKGVLRGEGEGVRRLMAEWEALDAELAAVGAEAARREEVGVWVYAGRC